MSVRCVVLEDDESQQHPAADESNHVTGTAAGHGERVVELPSRCPFTDIVPATLHLLGYDIEQCLSATGL